MATGVFTVGISFATAVNGQNAAVQISGISVNQTGFKYNKAQTQTHASAGTDIAIPLGPVPSAAMRLGLVNLDAAAMITLGYGTGGGFVAFATVGPGEGFYGNLTGAANIKSSAASTQFDFLITEP